MSSAWRYCINLSRRYMKGSKDKHCHRAGNLEHTVFHDALCCTKKMAHLQASERHFPGAAVNIEFIASIPEAPDKVIENEAGERGARATG